MHLLLVDLLTCPRCGPSFGLVLLARRVVERRVLEGALGCPNCRDQFPVVDGFADLRAPPRKVLDQGPEAPDEPDAEATLRLAALLGVSEGPAHVALVGPIAAHAAKLAGMIPELEVAAIRDGLASAPEQAGVSRMISRPGLPFRSAALRAIVLSGDASGALLQEAARVVAPSARVVLFDPPDGADAASESAGLHVLLRQSDVLVAERAGPRTRAGGVPLPVVR